tara:strand:+ start:273 stop:413 length:141 start_codon:yes stop_codon:yes gene_type:complete
MPIKINDPEAALRQNAVTIGSAEINLTNKESGTTSITPMNVINNPF